LAQINNVKLNGARFTGSEGKDKSLRSPPALLPGIKRVTSLKILGVTVSSKPLHYSFFLHYSFLFGSARLRQIKLAVVSF